MIRLSTDDHRTGDRQEIAQRATKAKETSDHAQKEIKAIKDLGCVRKAFLLVALNLAKVFLAPHKDA